MIFLFIPTEVCHQISVNLANTFALQSRMHHWLARLFPLRETHFSPCGQSPHSLFNSQQQRKAVIASEEGRTYCPARAQTGRKLPLPGLCLLPSRGQPASWVTKCHLQTSRGNSRQIGFLKQGAEAVNVESSDGVPSHPSPVLHLTLCPPPINLLCPLGPSPVDSASPHPILLRPLSLLDLQGAMLLDAHGRIGPDPPQSLLGCQPSADTAPQGLGEIPMSYWVNHQR